MAYARNSLDGWDPMAESYYDANINSYERGPAANLAPYARAPANSEYKLYVNNIPLELDETGILQIFSRYGKALHVYSPRDGTWAYVTFGSFREAETAIRVLNNAPPLNLNVTFAKKKTEESRNKKSTRHGIPNIESVPQPHSTVAENQRREYINPEYRQILRPLVRNLGRGQELALLARNAIAPPCGPMCESEDLLYPSIHDPNFYDPYEEAEPFADTNAMWTRGRMQVSNDGTRFVTMGRGHAWYELPAPHPKVHQQIRAVYDNREAGLCEYGVNKFAQQVGMCQNCMKPATMRCQRCREFYCSRACQETDWPRHKVDCQPMPPLEIGLDSGSLSLSSGDEVVPVQERVTRVPMRRPLRSAGVPTVPNSTSTPLPSTLPDSGTSVLNPASTLESQGKENNSLLAQNNFKRGHSGDQKKAYDPNKPANSGGWNPTREDSDTQAFISRNSQGERPLMKQNYQQTRPESKDMPPPPMKQNYQQGRQEYKSFENRNGQNQHYGGSGQRSQLQPRGGQQNKNFFPRGGDRGNQEQLNHQQMREQVESLNINNTEIAKPILKTNDVEIAKPFHKANNMEIAKPILKANDTAISKPVHTRCPDPDMSFRKAKDIPKTSNVKSPPKVSFTKSSNDNATAGPPGTQSSPKPVTNNVTQEAPQQVPDEARVIDPLGPSISPCKSENKMKNIVELLVPEEDGILETHVLLGGDKAAVTVGVLKIEVEMTKCHTLTQECNKLPPISDFKPSIGDLVCGKRLNDWIRGTVTSLGPPMRIAAVDEGRVEPVTAVRPIPCEFVNIPTLGAICELTEGEFKLEKMAQYTFIVEKVNPDSVQVIIFSSDDKEGKGFIKPWKPAPEQKGIPYASLTNGTEVGLVTFRSHTLIFVRSLVPQDLEVFQRLTQDVARWSTKASPLTSPPVEGEIVIAKYAADDNFYRAIVRKIVDKKITVSYIDFGNIEITELENIRPISPDLKEYPSCVARIVLKDVPKDVAMTKEVSDYLGELTGKEIPLMCTFESSPRDGVVLKAADGTCVNDKIKELLTPSWKKKKDETTAFMIDDMEMAELGPVGETRSVIPLYSYGPLLHAMAPHDLELIGHITDVMAAQMVQYCNETKEHYIPRQNELCLAPFEGLWYRAVCMETNTTPTSSMVNYIDFGNIEVVEHTNLKLITKDFTTVKTLASVCSVVGLGPVDADGELPETVANRVMQLVPANKPMFVKIVECSKPGEYTVELPEVRKALVEEGLIKE